MRARKRFGQHFLEPAWVAQGRRRDRTRARRHVPRDRPRPRRAHPAAGRARRRTSSPSRSTATWRPRCRASSSPNVHVVEGDFLDASTSRAALALPTPAPIRVAGNLPYNVASPILFKLVELHAAGVPLARRDADAAEARSPIGWSPAPGTQGLRRADDPDRARRATSTRLLTLPPGAFRPPPKVHVGASSASRFTRRRRRSATAASSSALVRGDLHAAPEDAGERAPARAGRAGWTAAALLDAAGLDGRRRPETLTIDELRRLRASCRDSLAARR